MVAKADIAHAPYTPGVVYSDGHEHAWERALRTKVPTRPATLIVDPRGRVVWRHDGEIDAHELATALRKVLIGGRPVVTRTLKPNVRIGHRPPDFLFELAAGQQLTLRKMTEPVTLVFWNSHSQESTDAVLRAKARLLLAINDGEPVEAARRAAAAHRLPGILVTDPRRAISSAYGVTAWPLSISIDASGMVTELSYGTLKGELDRPVQQASGAAE